MQDNPAAVANETVSVCPADDVRQAQAARKNLAEFLPLYQRYVRQVYRYCLVRLPDQAAAEDATSEIFLKALDKLQGYRGGSFPAWLFARARNVVTDHTRKQRPHRLDAALQLVDGDSPPESRVISEAERHALHDSMTKLSKEQRALLEMQLAGWQDAQIAEALGKTRDAVKMLRLRALKRLNVLLTKAGWNFSDHLSGPEG